MVVTKRGGQKGKRYVQSSEQTKALQVFDLFDLVGDLT